MARPAASQMIARARAFACSRMVMAAALIVGLGHLAEVNRAAAQPAAPGTVEQAPFSPFAPFPPPAPPPVQVAPPATQPAQRANEARRVVRPQRSRPKVAARKRQPVERRQQVVKRKESRRKLAESHENQREIAERKGYKRVSDLVNFPKFFPGLGIIFVKPDTLPVGPFLCFDREDRLVATVYMIPIKDIDDHKTLEAAGVTAPVDHVSFYFNSGHPGVDMPHYHFVIWHVSKKDEARVAQ
jgi:hypothetical protein